MRHLLTLVTLLVLTSCYRQLSAPPPPAHTLSEAQQDSLAFITNHHYTNNYNFLVAADSIILLSQQPEEAVADCPTDTITMHKREHIVVADIRIIPTDTIDTVWVQVANERALFGWAHEGELLHDVVPDDPISQFINIFSDTYILIFIIFLVVIVSIYLVVMLRKKDVPIVHQRDINSFYPTLLCLVVAAAAVLYTSIQMFAPEQWQHFYFYPTLNPFAVPTILSLFLIAIWAMIIITIAVVDVVFKLLPVGEGLLYMGSTLAMCAVNYTLFTLTTHIYVGYALFAAYIYYALDRYFRYAYKPYACGRCGGRLRRKGRCPYCGTMNE